MGGKFVRHGPCPHCGSSDAYSLYSTGSAFCFSCQTYDKVAYQQTPATTATKAASDTLLPVDQFKPLQKRKITKATCEFYGYFVSTYKGCPVQVAPYYKKRKLVAQHLRFPNKDFIWLGKPNDVELFGQHLWSPNSPRLIITEGEIDCLSVAQVFGLKWPVVSVSNGAQSAKKVVLANLHFVNQFPEVVLAFDNDEQGKKAAQEVAAVLTPGRVKLFRYPSEEVKDPNELLQAGQGQMIAQGVFQAVPYRPDGIIAGTELYDAMWSELAEGFLSPYPALNDLLYGFRKGELYLFTAGSGIGKSTIVHEIAAHFLREHKLKIGVLALEESKRRTAERYGTVVLNKPLHLPHIKAALSEEEKKKAFEETIGSGRFWLYDHWGSTQIGTLLNNLRYLAVGCAVDWIVLDHISIVVSGLDDLGDSERQTIDRLMTKLRQLVEETGVGVLAVVHLSRPKDGKSWNEGRAVSLTSLRGSGALEQLSDVVIALERNQYSEDPDLAVVRVIKNRPIGKIGKADVLRYNHNTGRLLPVEAGDFNTDEELF